MQLGVAAMLPEITDEQREEFARILTGEHDDDLIRRGDVYKLIRKLRVSDLSLKNPQTYQRALSDIQRQVAKLSRGQAYD